MSSYDIAVIGGGPGGYVAAIKAAQAGKSVLLAEKGEIGGVCLNRGCIPTKSMIKSISVLNVVRECAKFGIRGVDTADISLDVAAMQARTNQVVRRLTGGVRALLKGNGVTVKAGVASFRDRSVLAIDGELFKAASIIIATGSKPASLPVPISGNAPVITSDQALQLSEMPKDMVITGGGVIGIEFAYIFSQLGVKCTVIEMLPNILPMVDDEISLAVRRQLEADGVTIITGARVTKINKRCAYYQLAEREQAIEGDCILMAVGRVPNTDGLNLESLGVRMNRSAIAVDQHMQTSVSGLYAIGDVNGQSMLAHTASMEALVAVNHILGNDLPIDYRKIPCCIYIHPEIASIGLTESQARAEFAEVKVGTFPISANGKSVVEGETRGKIKVIVDGQYGGIVGVHIYSVHASDMIAEIALAMNGEMTVDDVVAAVHPHPSISEIIPEAFHAAVHKAVHSL
jgi:dihydrolipoamide dehydrogenase